MKLTIHNITNIVNTKINTTHAQWVIEYVMSNEEYYTIKVTFVFGKTMGKKHPKHVYFQLYRDKDSEGYWVLDSTEQAILRWGLHKGNLDSMDNFLFVLKRQLETL
jgi:hypothetical protein